MIYTRIKSEFERLEQRIADVQERLKQMPEGSLLCAKNGKYFKWYRFDGKVTSYIPKSQRKLAEQLAVKRYLKLVQKEQLAEYEAMRAYLMKYPIDKESQRLLEHPEYRQLLKQYFQPLDEELLEWQEASYEKNEKYPEQLVHKCGTGHIVRSKSEAMIVTFLQHNRIPFRYECALYLDRGVVYPDFTIRHPKTGEVYLWEHFGLMDHLDYVHNFCSKMQMYVASGFIPSVRLITTYETKEHPLTIDVIERTIRQYFG